MLALDLDFVTDSDTPEAVLAEAREWADCDEVEVSLVTLTGPAGGWPVVRFVGEAQVLWALAKEYHDGDEDAASATLSECPVA